MKKKPVPWLFYLLIVILILSSILMLYLEQQNRALEAIVSDMTLDHAEQIQQMQENLDVSDTELKQCNAILDIKDSTISDISSNLDTLTSDYDALMDKQQKIEAQIDDTLSKLDTYKAEINSSLQWYKSNSLVDGVKREDKIKNSLRMQCIKETYGRCLIKLGCLLLVNQEDLDLHYQTDPSLSGKADKLQSLSEFIDNRGGDCEDYSLFYKAEMNYLESLCDKPEEIVLEAWTPYEMRGLYYLDIMHHWYIELAKAYELPAEYIHPAVVCGQFLDGEYSGHCIVAFTKKKISSIDAFNELDAAPLVEPQNGIYMGQVNYPSSNVLMPDNPMFEKGKHSYIQRIITDNDFFLYSDEYGWLGYSLFYSEIEDYIQLLQNN